MTPSRHATISTSPRSARRRRAPLGRRRRQRGLTLIEVMATVVLLGVVLPVAMEGLSYCVAAAGAARQRDEAAGLAEAKMAEIIATGDWQYQASFAGDFGEDFPEYRWEAQVLNTPDAELDTLRELAVRVTWTSRGEPREFDVSTYVYQPADSTTTSTSGFGF
jgi:prepilin-type N-terminal cleavage/methylation domain-containing protein